MPPRGGAFFGFAIIIAAALATWGIIALVELANDSDDSDDYASSREADSDVQEALNNASPGDTIYIPEGTSYISLTTAVDGTEDEPITITCVDGLSKESCILRGDDRARVLEILHSHYIIEGFTVDGEGDDDDEYREQLIYVEGSRDPTEEDGVQTSITGVHIQGMTLRNAGKECVRLRYFVTNSVVQANEIGPCGIEDFEQGSSGSNGEGVYIGTALNQIDEKNGDDVVDVCTGIVVMGNEIDTQGSEGVDIKEGSYGNIIYNNEILGQQDEESGGISLRGDDNIVFENNIVEGEGACIRIGGHEYDDVDYGKNNEVYENNLDGCKYSAVKVNESPQIICDNTVVIASDPNDDDEYAYVRGDAAAEFSATLTDSCPALTTVSLPAVYVPGGTDDSEDDDEVVEEDDDDSGGSGSVVVVDDDEVVLDDDSDDDEEDDDDAVVDPDNTYTYIGCYNDNPSDPVLPTLAIEDDDLSVEECIAACVANQNVYAGFQKGSECWCGDNDEYDDYGDGQCTFECAGSGDDLCGGESSFSLYVITGDGGVDITDDPQDDDGGIGGDQTTTSSTSDDDDDSVTSGSVVVVSKSEEDDAEATDDDPTTTTEGDDAILTSGTYVDCFKDDDKDPILQDFMYEDEDSLTPAKCIATCEDNYEMAGLQNRNQCWCGTATMDELSRYGDGLCNMPCSGNSNLKCGGEESASVYTVD